MTVAELLEILKNCDPTMPVVIYRAEMYDPYSAGPDATWIKPKLMRWDGHVRLMSEKERFGIGEVISSVVK